MRPPSSSSPSSSKSTIKPRSCIHSRSREHLESNFLSETFNSCTKTCVFFSRKSVIKAHTHAVMDAKPKTKAMKCYHNIREQIIVLTYNPTNLIGSKGVNKRITLDLTSNIKIMILFYVGYIKKKHAAKAKYAQLKIAERSMIDIGTK